MLVWWACASKFPSTCSIHVLHPLHPGRYCYINGIICFFFKTKNKEGHWKLKNRQILIRNSKSGSRGVTWWLGEPVMFYSFSWVLIRGLCSFCKNVSCTFMVCALFQFLCYLKVFYLKNPWLSKSTLHTKERGRERKRLWS